MIQKTSCIIDSEFKVETFFGESVRTYREGCGGGGGGLALLTTVVATIP